MITITVETGSGTTGANSYISLADANTYFEGNVYASNWTSANDAQRSAALVHATRMIDQQVQWNGFRTFETQPLAWPRQEVFDPDDAEGDNLDDTTIPQWLKDVVCELALVLLTGARETDPDGQGIAEFELTGVLKVKFNEGTAKRPLPDWLTAVVLKYGTVTLARSGVVKLIRA
jgi:hypothetical protein